MLRVHLLGGLKLALGGEPVLTIPGRPAWSLHTSLVIYRTHDHLAGLCWPDLPDRVARHRLGWPSCRTWTNWRPLSSMSDSIFSPHV